MNQRLTTKLMENKEGEEFKDLYNHYLDKRENRVKSIETSCHEKLGVVSGKIFSFEQVTKRYNISAKMM